MIGQTLAHYKILSKLGSGGMADVYLAEDTKLSRKVALKVLPPEMAEDEGRRKRFEREARALASLNHPHIVPVYSVEEAGGFHFITMELVRGENLSELLPKAGFSLSRFFDLTIPLVDAIAAAHAAGIMHRDLKPENVMMSEDGRVKVLDFGLARPARGAVRENDGSELPTETKTREGEIVGTLAYMSPEQAEGKPVDQRSDIFSLGVMFFQMLTGSRPFRGATAAGLLASLLKDAPPSVTELNPDIPPDLSKIVLGCLAKDPSLRFQSAVDIRNELDELRADLGSGTLRKAERRGGSGRPIKWITGGVFFVLLAVTLYVARRPGESVPRLLNPTQVTSAVGVENFPAWSPDGRQLAYESDQSGNWDIWVVQPGGEEPVNRTADHTGPDRSPSWAPDGRQIAFLSQRENVWGLFSMSALGGSLRRLTSRRTSLGMTGDDLVSFLGAPRWSARGDEIAVAFLEEGRNFLEIVTPETQDVRRLPLPYHQGNGSFDLSWSPDGRYLAYVDAITTTADVTRL